MESRFIVISGVDPMCFSGSGPAHFFRSWVRIGIEPTHFLRWIVYYCVCIQHDIDNAAWWLDELMGNGLLVSFSQYGNQDMYWLLLLTRLVSVNIVLWQQNLKFSFHQQTVEFGPTHILHRSTPLTVINIYRPNVSRKYTWALTCILFT